MNTTELQLEQGEELVVKVRKHLIVYLSDLMFHGTGLVLFVLVIIVFSYLSNGEITSYVSLASSVLVLFTWLSFFASWTSNYFDVWYVTNRHIVAINQKDLLDREEAFMEFRRIQDVFFEKQGFLQTYLNYGTLRVQSAGTEQEFIMKSVHDVEEVAHIIMELRDKVKGEGAV